MKSTWPPLAAIFFMTYFHRAGGGMVPFRPPWICYCISQFFFVFLNGLRQYVKSQCDNVMCTHSLQHKFITNENLPRLHLFHACDSVLNLAKY